MSLDIGLIKEAVAKAEEHRAYLHTVPEQAFGEFRTTEYIRGICEGYPVRIIDLGMETGLVCYLDAGQTETIALRADIDAVPTERGPFHLCGHDAHAASLLGAMHYLCGLRHPVPYNVLFVFQPAEEGTRGARAMLDHGLLEKVPQRPLRIFGIHNRPEEDCGDIVVHRGPLMSEKSVFSITLTGRPGHGALPHKCVDPVVAAGSLIMSMQTIVSRNVDPFEPCICTFNSVHAGDSESSAPESAKLTGYIRSFDHATHERMEERLERLAKSTADAYECRCTVKIERLVPAVINGDDMYDHALKAAKAAIGMSEQAFEDRGHVIDSSPCLASEDFAVFGTEIPSFFYWAGSGTPGKKCAPWHDPAFCIDKKYTETAVPLLIASAITE